MDSMVAMFAVGAPVPPPAALPHVVTTQRKFGGQLTFAPSEYFGLGALVFDVIHPSPLGLLWHTG